MRLAWTKDRTITPTPRAVAFERRGFIRESDRVWYVEDVTEWLNLGSSEVLSGPHFWQPPAPASPVEAEPAFGLQRAQKRATRRR